MNEVIHHPNVEDIVRLPGTGECNEVAAKLASSVLELAAQRWLC